MKCCVHNVHRIIVTAIPESDFIGDLYAVKFIAHLCSYYNTMYRGLRCLVNLELEVLLREEVLDAEYEAWQVHNDNILRHTLSRHILFTRGRLGPDCKPARGEEAAMAVYEKCRLFINGDARRRCCNMVLTAEVEAQFPGVDVDDLEATLKEAFLLPS